MGRVTKIETLNLQTFAIDLKAKGLSEAKIGLALTKKAGTPISRDMVNKFFRGRAQANVQVVERSDKLKKKLVEAEINTIEECMKCIKDLQDVFDKAIEDGDLRAAILATGEKWKGIDIINKVLGKYQNLPAPNVNFFVNSASNTPQVKDAASVLCQAIREAQDAEFIEADD